MTPVVAALQAMRGIALVVAVTVVAEVGDFRRFANPRQLMAYLGLVPSEHSSGASVRRGGITKAGNVLARRVLIEGAWTYRMPARVSRKLHDRNEKLSPAIRDIAWIGQMRLCSRYRRLAAARVRRTPAPISGWRRRISSKMATGRSPGTLLSNGTTSLSQTADSGSRLRRPRGAFFCEGAADPVRCDKQWQC